MQLFKDGRGLLRRVRWARVVLVTAAIGAGASWARRDARDDAAAGPGALKTPGVHWCWQRGDETDANALEDARLEQVFFSTSAPIYYPVDTGGTRKGYMNRNGREVATHSGVPVGK